MHVFEEIPKEVTLDPIPFLKWLGTSTVIAAGKGEESIIISCLMHGNEPSGFFAVHKLLKRLHNADFLQKRVYFIFMNVRAALQEPFFSKRHCDDESDMNRLWGPEGVNAEQNSRVKKIMDFIAGKKPSLIIDIHNTTGNNPLFAILTELEKEKLEICSLFSPVIVCFASKSTLIEWTEQFGRSITIECGRNNDPQSHANAEDVLNRALVFGGAIEGQLEPYTGLRVLYEPELIEIFTKDIAFSDDNTGEDLVLRTDLDRMNTIEIPKDTFIGWENRPGSIKSSALETINKRIITKQACTFTLMTTVVDVVKKDTLGYVVKTKEGSINSLMQALQDSRT